MSARAGNGGHGAWKKPGGQAYHVNWAHVAEGFAGRDGRQCRERWIFFLDPDVVLPVQQPWREEEDLMIIQCHQTLGNQWSKIAKFLPGRTSSAVKNRFLSNKRKQFKTNWVLDGGKLALRACKRVQCRSSGGAH